MSSMVNSLNLRPQEKRIIVGIGVVIFIVLNVALVFPHFKDYGKIAAQLKDTRAKIASYRAIIAKDTNPGDGWKDVLDRLEEHKGGAAMFKEIQLQQTVTDKARSSGVFIQNISPVSSQVIGPGSAAEKFFESQSIRIVVQAAEEGLVKFLRDVGTDPAMIRVRELELHPLDNNRYKLNAAITITADYEKTAPAKPILTTTEAAPKKPAPPPTPAPTRAGARSALTNASPPTPGRAPATPAPGRAVTPPVPPMPPMPPRPARTVPGGQA